MSVLSLVTALASLVPVATLPRTTVEPFVARVPNSIVHVAFRAADFKPDVEELAKLRKTLGDKPVACGVLSGTGSNFSILAERNDTSMSASEYRDALAVDGFERFDLGDVPCLELRVDVEPLINVEYHAYVGAARYMFDVHVSVVLEGDQPAFGQAELAELLGSLRFAYLRRALWSEYPSDVLAWMDTIARRMPNWLERSRADLEYEPKNWALTFAVAEALRFQHAPANESLELYPRVLDLLAREVDGAASLKLVTVLAEEGFGLSLGEEGRTKETLAHFRRGYDLAKAMNHEVRSALAYNLACSYAELKDEPNTLTWLTEAIAVAPRYRAVARDDADFTALRKSDAFRKLTDEPRPEAPAKR
ncbi:MAG: hypothetical protein K8S98_15690 [Planctomycetes bacterium]|nr:hypothetical protein [Planctomycetota bacterium]